MKINRNKVYELQRNLALFDFTLGRPARKSSKTYTNEYARLYEQQEIASARTELMYYL
jgi:hypothetical protein